MVAALSGNLPTVQYLVGQGADVHMATEVGLCLRVSSVIHKL